MRYVVYGALALAAFLLQSGVLPQAPVFGIEIDLLTPMIGLIALFGDAYAGLIAAAVTGLSMDLLFSTVIGFYSLPLVTVALLCRLLKQTPLDGSLLCAPIVGAGGYLIKELLSMLAAALMHHAVHPAYMLLRYVLPGCAICGIVALALYIGMVFLTRLAFMQPPRKLDLDGGTPVGKEYLRG